MLGFIVKAPPKDGLEGNVFSKVSLEDFVNQIWQSFLLSNKISAKTL